MGVCSSSKEDTKTRQKLNRFMDLYMIGSSLLADEEPGVKTLVLYPVSCQ